jgi:hypothetical protein
LRQKTAVEKKRRQRKRCWLDDWKAQSGEKEKEKKSRRPRESSEKSVVVVAREEEAKKERERREEGDDDLNSSGVSLKFAFAADYCWLNCRPSCWSWEREKEEHQEHWEENSLVGCLSARWMKENSLGERDEWDEGEEKRESEIGGGDEEEAEDALEDAGEAQEEKQKKWEKNCSFDVRKRSNFVAKILV